MLRRTRCRSCGSIYYTLDVTAECQDCTGSHDNLKQAERDAEAIKRANAPLDTAPQSVDPRTGQPGTAKKKEKAK